MSSARAGAAGKRPRWEVADVFHLYGEAYRSKHCLPSSQLDVMRAIEVCRTAELGGHLERCDECGFERPVYNSCRNRHCPKCQALTKARWLEARKRELLPAGYFHNVFTIPHDLNAVALRNKRVIFDILFRAASQTLKEFAEDSKHGLRGKLGFIAILHTWNQKLLDHIHLHCVIPGGALSLDRRRWVHAHKGFLFPVKALSAVFRGKFIHLLKKAFAARKLLFPAHAAPLKSEEGFSRLVDRLWKKDWVVYSKKPFAGPEKVLDYLGRYTHRVAISNHRITNVEGGAVSFTYRDRSDRNRQKVMTLSAFEFIRRFLLHVLPKAYVRIRHFGFLANRSKGRDLPRCRELLGIPAERQKPAEKTPQEIMLEITGVEITRCPRCGRGTMRIVQELLPPSEADLAQPEVVDTS